MRTVYRNHERFENTYFKKFPGFYVTGDGKPQNDDISTVGSRNNKEPAEGEANAAVRIHDLISPLSGCKRDKDGYYWITGRIDDMLNVSGTVLRQRLSLGQTKMCCDVILQLVMAF